jgi:glutamine amidotransferase PdxT
MLGKNLARKTAANDSLISASVLILAIFISNGIFILPSWSKGQTMSVALFVDKGASVPAKKNFKRLLYNSDFSWKTVEGPDIENGCLKDYDALIVPGGSALKEARSMGPAAREEVRRFVRDGGIYLGVCAGAYLSTKAKENDLGLIPVNTLDQEHWFRTPDGTDVKVELTEHGMEVFGLERKEVDILYENGPIFGPPLESAKEPMTPLAFYRSEVVAEGGKRGVMLGAPAAILARYGRGTVLALSPHPEKTPHLGHIIIHALRWMYNQKEQPSQEDKR